MGIEYLAFVYKRVIVSRTLTSVIVSGKVIKKHSLIACSMARTDDSQIFLSYKYLISEVSHKGYRGSSVFSGRLR